MFRKFHVDVLENDTFVGYLVHEIKSHNRNSLPNLFKPILNFLIKLSTEFADEMSKKKNLVVLV